MSKEEIREFREQNRKERLWFIDLWADYVKTHPDEDWSRQQNVIINSIYGEIAKKNRELLKK